VKLVVDASVAVAASSTPVGFARFRGIELVAPPLLWIEAGSVLHAMMWRGELRRDQAEPMVERVHSAPIKRVRPKGAPAGRLDPVRRDGLGEDVVLFRAKRQRVASRVRLSRRMEAVA
jgi:hypothetical protein